MQKNNSQNKLYQNRMLLKQSIREHTVSSKQYVFLFKFFERNKRLLSLVFTFLGIQVFTEILFFSLTHNIINTLGTQFYQRFNKTFLITGFILIFVYVYIVFVATRLERKLILRLVNKTREHMFRNTLRESLYKVSIPNRFKFITKVSYHLSLFSMGIDNTFISLARWFFYFAALCIYVLVFNINYALYIPLILGINCLCFLIAYKISNLYISKEVASYSKITDYIVHVIYNLPFLKRHKREKDSEKMLLNVVDVDTYFRLRRDTWIRYSNRLVFIVISIIVVIYSLLHNTPNDSLIGMESASSFFLKGLVSIYIIRLCYLSLRAGLYAIPLKIGTSLCVPEESFSPTKIRIGWDWKSITFISNKVKLFNEGQYLKDFRFSFSKGHRYLFFGKDSFLGKTSLAQLFSGEASFSRHSFLVQIDTERISYNQWSETFGSKYFFSTQNFGSLTVGEFLFGKDKQYITTEDISTLDLIIKKSSILKDFSLANNFLAHPIEEYHANYITLFRLHYIYTLIHKPELITIDNLWIDLDYPEINEMITSLSSELNLSTIIVFSRKQNNTLGYESIYEITKSSINKVI